MRSSIKRLSILLVIFLVVFITACEGLTDIDFEREDEVKRVTSSDNQSSISVPENWHEDIALNDQADINVASPQKEQYAIVLTESTNSFSEDMTLDYYFELISENMKMVVKDSTTTGPKKTQIDNKPAILFEIHGEVEKVKISYLIALVEGQSNYYQIITWTLENKFEDYKDLYLDIINSFKANEDNTAANKDNLSKNEGKESNFDIVSTDGEVQLTVTEEWKETLEPLSEDSNISIINKAKDMYLIIIPDSKKYFTDDMTLDNYYSLVLENMEVSLTDSKSTNQLNNPLENYNSIQSELFGEISKIKLGYSITAVETEDSYYQIIAWTSKPTFLKYKDELSNIINTFKVIK